MACEAAGMSLTDAAMHANRLSAAVVSHPGATLPVDRLTAWKGFHPLF